MVSELLGKAEDIAKRFGLAHMPEIPQRPCLCRISEDRNDKQKYKLHKKASHDESDDSYFYYPAATDESDDNYVYYLQLMTNLMTIIFTIQQLMIFIRRI